MPVPLTTAALSFSAILMLGDLELAAIIIGSAGVLNQMAVVFSTPAPAPDPDAI
jgi:hypothetical protein